MKNLFSVLSAANKGVVYWLDDKECKIIRDDVVLVTGERQQGLYKLNMRLIGLASEEHACVAKSVDSLQVWHERLGHQNK